jgi:hypothetical protein
MKVHKAREVFGITRDIPLNYVVREKVDHVLLDNLTRDKHIVIYGSSKQGKTCLRKHCLNDSDYITVTCLNRWDLGELHSSILKQAGYRTQQSVTKTISGKNMVAAQFAGEGALLNLAKASGQGSYNYENQKSHQSTEMSLELDPFDVNDIILALININFDKFIVLEDFHYLPADTQRDFCFTLKSFHENSKLCFIVVGVWREENRLISYNGDLTDRVISIDADKWDQGELGQAIDVGEKLLNIHFDNSFRTDILTNCFSSIHFVQEACLRCCQREGVSETQSSLRTIGRHISAKQIIRQVVDEQKSRYMDFLLKFSEGFQSTDLEMYKWILYPVLSAEVDELTYGLRLTDSARCIKSKHPRGAFLNNGNITQALLSAATLQVKKEVRPIILDYDINSRVINVVDRGFLLWLANQDRIELLSYIDLPSEPVNLATTRLLPGI